MINFDGNLKEVKKIVIDTIRIGLLSKFSFFKIHYTYIANPVFASNAFLLTMLYWYSPEPKILPDAEVSQVSGSTSTLALQFAFFHN